MITRIDNLKLTIEESLHNEKEALLRLAAKKLRCSKECLKDLLILKKSLDARDKSRLIYVYSIAVFIKNGGRLRSKLTPIKLPEYKYPSLNTVDSQRPVIIGAGPAGLFCAYALSAMGLRPIILERGKPVEERQKDIDAFWSQGKLLADSNVLFGEGGAGTFSDGKLNTLNKDINGRNTEVLRIFATLLDDPQLRYINKPHVGTDKLIEFCRRMRESIIDMGGEFHFSCKMTDINIQKGKVISITADGEEYFSFAFVLAIGHSSRDTFELLKRKSIPMEAKAFAIGYRVAHPQAMINISQYGSSEAAKLLSPASYKLTYKSTYGRGVYSFCMCPGGYIVNSSSEEGRLCVNGMSYSDRGGEYANSAIIVTVDQKDYTDGYNNPLAGIELQRRLEEKTYEEGLGGIPYCRLASFAKSLSVDIDNSWNSLPNAVNPDKLFKGKVKEGDVAHILPEELSISFIEGMKDFGRKIEGFSSAETIVAGIESRTSSPVRILRNSQGQSAVSNLYPCGEGAGYAGGITSAAMDGLFIAECIGEALKNKITIS